MIAGLSPRSLLSFVVVVAFMATIIRLAEILS